MKRPTAIPEPLAAGWWLAREPWSRVRSASLVYVRALHDSEVQEIHEALAYFRGLCRRPDVASLLRSHHSWDSAMESAAQTRYMGPLVTDIATRALEQLLPTWRMALEFLKRGVDTEFGTSSAESSAYRAATHRAYDTYFGYRLIEALRNAHLHHSIPPLRQDVHFDVITCDRCGKEHHINPELVLELPRDYLVALEKCPAALKRELPRQPMYLDLREAVAEAMRGFFDVLFAFGLLDPATRARLDVLTAVCAEAEPDQPLVMHWWQDDGSPKLSYEDLSGVHWAVRRARLDGDGTRRAPTT